MTMAETAKLIASIGKVWPSFAEHRDLDGTIAIWQRVFADDEAALVGQALGIFIATDTRGFAPVPGQLKEIMATIRSAAENGSGSLTDQEAWHLVSKACANSGYHAEEEFRRLPPVCRQIVGSASVLREWSQIDTDRFQTVIASNFMRSYRVRAQQEREYSKLPSSLRALMPAIGQTIGALPGETGPEALPEPETLPEESVPMPAWFKSQMEAMHCGK